MSGTRTMLAIKGLRHSILRSLLAGVLLPALLISVWLSPQQAYAASGADCDNNAVVYCGASSVNGLIAKYNNGDGRNSAHSIQAIFNSFGISSSDIQAMGSTAQSGSVSSSGNVFVGNQLVATNALTAGRQNMAGSTRRGNQGTVFYTRPPRVSFQSSTLQAFVVMKNGVFQFAILTSCGNPVMAHPKPKPTPPPQKPHPQTPAPAPTKPKPRTRSSTNVCNGSTSNSNSGVASQSGNCSTNTTNNTTVMQAQTPPPAPPAPEAEIPPPSSSAAPESAPTESPPAETVAAAPVATPAAEKGPTELPNTGAGGILSIFGITSAVGTIGYRLFLGRYLGHL
jgi:hypothetical protein